ncbi:MAG: FtsW/RodA/SpoVE family cell cycle protein, partial [Mycobacteriaceae bacterium]
MTAPPFPSPPEGFAAAPIQPTRRNIELALLGGAVAIVTISLLLVEASQEQKITWDLAKYAFAYLGLFTVAHLAVRRLAPYADPLLLPIVALLNGIGLVFIHRLDLADQESAAFLGKEIPSPDANQQVLWTLLAIIGFCLVLFFLPDHRTLSRYAYTVGLIGLLFLALPALLPSSLSEVNGAKIWIVLPFFSIQPGEFSKILLLIFFASILVAKRDLFTAAGKHILGMDLPRARDLGPILLAWAISVGVLVFEKDLGTSLLL